MTRNPTNPEPAFRVVLAAGLALGLGGCMTGPVGSGQSGPTAAARIAERSISAARLGLARGEAQREINLSEAGKQRPVGARGAAHEAYLRWRDGTLPELPDPGQTVRRVGE